MAKQKLGSDPLGWIQKTAKGTKKPQGSKKIGRPRTNTREITKSSQEGLPEGWTRATFIMREAFLEKLKDVAYWDRKQVKEVVNEAVEAYLKDKKVKRRADSCRSN